MEQERNYAGYMGHMLDSNCCHFPMPKHEKNMSMMPPYMYGKGMMNENMPYPNCTMNTYEKSPMNNYYRQDMPMMPYHMQKMEPLELMCGKTYNILIVYVKKTVQKIVMENMGMMPNSISKDMFNKHCNEMMCEVLKKEEEIKKLVVVDRYETEEPENTDRSFCPFCHGMLKDTLTTLLVVELLRGGCKFCH